MRLHRFRFVVYLAVFWVVGCGHSRLPAPGVKPGWISRPNRTHPNLIYVTGSCRGIRRRELARRCAIGDAKYQLRKALNRQALRFESSYVKDEHFEYSEKASTGQLRFDWWVLVAYPRKPAGTASSPPGSTSAEERHLLERWRALNQRSQNALLALMEELAASGASNVSAAARSTSKNLPVMIFVHHGIGTTQRARIWGRVIGGDLKTSTDAPGEPKGMSGIKVQLEIIGKQHVVETDGDGNFSLELQGPLPIGTHAVRAKTADAKVAHLHDGRLTIYPRGGGTGGGTILVSSLRNTIVRSSRLCEAILALSPQSVLLARPRHLKRCTRIYPGALKSVRRWTKAKGPVIYLSPLPPDSYPLFQRVLKVHGFAPAPMFFAGRAIKDLRREARARSQTAALKELLALLPGYRAILVGNDVSTDIAAFAAVASDQPQRIARTYIHHVPYRNDHQAVRTGQRRFSSYAEVRDLP